MRLSEAIRLGATMKPQAFDDFYDDSSHEASCALGAAADAIGMTIGTDDGDEIEWPDEWMRVFRATNRGRCPACNKKLINLDPIPHLNDDHRWTREQIADWIELNFEIPTPSETVVEETSVVEPSVTAPAAQS